RSSPRSGLLTPSHLGNRNFVGRSFHADLTPPTPLSLVERRSTLDRRPEGEGGGARGKTPPSPPRPANDVTRRIEAPSGERGVGGLGGEVCVEGAPREV